MTKPDLTPEHALEVVARVIRQVHSGGHCAPLDFEHFASVARYGAECLAAREAWAMWSNTSAHAVDGSLCRRREVAAATVSQHGEHYSLCRVLILPPEPREEGGKG